MKKITLLLVALSASIASAQTTFDLLWRVGIDPVDVSITVEPGDTVRWTWDDGLPHSVTSESGSQESFDSGVLTGSGTQYSYTFTQVGINDYKCDVHSAMTGTITVEQLVGIDEKFRKNIKFYPNPVSTRLTVTSLYKLDTYKIYDVLGKTVAQGVATGNITDIDMSSLQSGIYFVNAISGDLQSTFKVTKN
jgi:hypothetical protein